MAEEEVVRLDVGVDDPHAVDELDEPQQLGRQVDRDRLDDPLVRILRQVHLGRQTVISLRKLSVLTRSSRVPILW